MNKFIYLTLVLSMLLFPASGQSAVKESLSRQNFRAAICNIDSMTVNVQVDESFGEPLINSRMSWSAGPNTSNSCLSESTSVWIKVRTESDDIRYIKIRPKVMQAGQTSPSTSTESPSWKYLFCNSPSDASICEPVAAAKRLFASNLRYEGFEVKTEALAVSSLGTSKSDPSTSKPKYKPGSTEDGEFSFDSILADAIDSAIEPTGKKPDEKKVAPQEVKKPPPEKKVVQKKDSKDKVAKQASTAIAALISNSLSSYSAPAHRCESSRKIHNSIQTRGLCKINLRSESNHQYLCADSGRASPVRSSSSAKLDLSKDIAQILDIRQSAEGWATLVIELNAQLQAKAEGNYKTNRWQFTVSDNHLEDLKKLASNLLTLVDYCEAKTT